MNLIMKVINISQPIREYRQLLRQTNIIFRDYERPGEMDHVIEGTYEISNEIWERVEEAISKSDSNIVPSIYRRNITAKIAYGHFIGG